MPKAAKRKKKAVHWSKQPRAKLVSMIRRLQRSELQLKARMSEMREAQLLNQRGQAETDRLVITEMREAQSAAPERIEPLFPWETDHERRSAPRAPA